MSTGMPPIPPPHTQQTPAYNNNGNDQTKTTKASTTSDTTQNVNSTQNNQKNEYLDQKIAGFATDVIKFTFKAPGIISNEIKEKIKFNDRRDALNKDLENTHTEMKALAIFKHIFMLPLIDIIDSFNPSKDTIKKLNDKVEEVKKFIFKEIILKDIDEKSSKIDISGKLFRNLVARPFAFIVGFFNRKTQFLPDLDKNIKDITEKDEKKLEKINNKYKKIIEILECLPKSIEKKILLYGHSRLEKIRKEKSIRETKTTDRYIKKINAAKTKTELNKIIVDFNKSDTKIPLSPQSLVNIQNAAKKKAKSP